MNAMALRMQEHDNLSGGLLKAHCWSFPRVRGGAWRAASVPRSRLLMLLAQGTPLYGLWNLTCSMSLGVIGKLLVWNVPSRFLDK